MDQIEKAMPWMSEFTRAALPALQFGVLGLAFLAVLAGFFLLLFQLLIQPTIPVRSPISFMLAAAFLMVIAALCRAPEFNAMQRDIADLRWKVNDLRGTGATDGYHFKQGGDLHATSYSGHLMDGACGGNSVARGHLNVMLGRLRSAEVRLNAIDNDADRLSRMLKVFQNPFQ